MVRIGIVGCGAITRSSHLPSLARLPECRVTALCDANIRSAAFVRAEFELDCAITAHVSELAERVDAVIVATSPRSHAPIAIQLMEMGIDVMCEKPLATSAAEAEQMVAVAERHHRILGVGLITRLHPNNEILRDVVQERVLGDINHVNVEFGARLDWPMTSDAYYRPTTTAGGVLFDAGVHFIDRLVSLFGELTDIQMWDDSYGGFESNAMLTGLLSIRGKSVPCSAAFSWTHQLANSIRVTGATGTAEVRMADAQHVWLSQIIAGKRRMFAISEDVAVSQAFDAYTAQLADFADCVVTRRDPLVSGNTAIPALRIIEQAYAVRKKLPQPWVETSR